MSVTVEPTSHNWVVYNFLCELYAELSMCDDEGRRADIIAKAVEICETLEVKE